LVRKSAALRALHAHAHGCWQDGNFLKDISAVRQDLSQVVIVDNSPVAYSLQVLRVLAPLLLCRTRDGVSEHQVTCTFHDPCVLLSDQPPTGRGQLTKTSPLHLTSSVPNSPTLSRSRSHARSHAYAV
jgi:hypothetical protein